MQWPWAKKIEELHALAVMGSIYMPDGDSVDAGSAIRPKGWQTDAWRLWKALGELHGPTNYLARVISRRIDFIVQTGNTDESQLDKERSYDYLEGALGETNLEEFIRLSVLNLEVAGEFWLLQTEKGWDVKAVTTQKLNELVDSTKAAGRAVLRVYDPDPENTNNADSGFRAAIDPAEDLLTLSCLSKAQSRSRIAQAGILLVPTEAQFTNGDPFGAGLNQVMTTAIKDTSSPAAVVPIKITMPADLIEKVKHLTFDRPFDDGVPGKIELATRRIALALDMPPEILLGIQDSNHWSAWVAQDETYNTAIAPLAEKVAAVLEFIVTTSLQQTVTIVLDPSELQKRRPQTGDVIDAAYLGAVSLAFVREQVGATEAEAPEPEDIAIIQGMRGRSGGSQDRPVEDQPSAPSSERRNRP